MVVIEKYSPLFMEENPDIYISYESLKGNDYYDALMKRLETGNGDDIFMVNHDTALQLEEEGSFANCPASVRFLILPYGFWIR